MESKQLASLQELSEFLKCTERRAYKQALFAVKDEDAALDIVQDAMLRLSEKYSHRPAEELPGLFQRILQNAIRDYYRRSKVRALWTTLMSSLFPSKEEEDIDPLDLLQVEGASTDPADEFERAQVMAIIEKALSTLPPRQREAFLLRYWENMDVAETAAVMGCSEGSVKTHCSRAVHAMAEILKSKGIVL